MDKYRYKIIDFIKDNTIVLLSLIISIYCLGNPVCEGLELLFLMPLSFGISCFIFHRAHSYWNANPAFIIIFFSIWIRYLATPLLMTISKSTVNTLAPIQASSFRLSTVIAIFELCVTLYIIERLWSRFLIIQDSEVEGDSGNNPDSCHSDFKLTWTGFLFLAALLGLIVTRGNVVSSFSQLSTWTRKVINTGDLNSYDIIGFEIIKTGIVLIIISFFAKKYYQTNSITIRFLCFIFALVAAVFNTYFFQYDQRTALTQLVLATLFMFLSFFPKEKAIVLPVAIFFGVGIVILVFLDGTLHYTIGDTVTNSIITNLSKVAELYDSGPSVLAKTIDTMGQARASFSIDTIWSDIIHSLNFLSVIPVTRWIFNSANGIPSSIELFIQSIGGYPYILPNYTFACYYVTELFGWILEIVTIWITIRIICHIEKNRRKYNDALYIYAVVYFEVILGQAIFVNNFRLLWHSFSNLPFWLLVFWYINRVGNRIKIRAH